MRVLVAGGAGFIGSNFVRHMLSSHDDVEIVNFDLLTYAGRLENLQDLKDDPRYRFVQGDIRDSKAVEPCMKERPDLVVNFAAETHVDRSVMDAGSFVLTDVYGTYILLEAARKFEVEKFVQISTDEVYGSIEKGSFRETDILACELRSRVALTTTAPFNILRNSSRSLYFEPFITNPCRSMAMGNRCETGST